MRNSSVCIACLLLAVLSTIAVGNPSASEPEPLPGLVPSAGDTDTPRNSFCVEGDNPPTTCFAWFGCGAVFVDVVVANFGTFTVSGIPSEATVVWAFMYGASWEKAPGNMASATFGDDSLPAVMPFDDDPGFGYTFLYLCSYRWDVTPLVRGNGQYSYSISGLAESYGDALVVIYSCPSALPRQIVVNDGAESMEYTSSTSIFYDIAADSATLFLFTQADDWYGSSELVSFNGTTVLGPGNVFYGNRGLAASLITLPVECRIGANAVTCSTDYDWFGWHLAILEAYGQSSMVTGGGWIGENIGSREAKRTFGFNAHSELGVVWGHLQFSDHATGMKVHGDTVATLAVHGDTCAEFSGTCRVGRSAGYTFDCAVEDRGEPGHGRDRFRLDVWDPDGNLRYSASGVLGGGNIQIHTVEDGIAADLGLASQIASRPKPEHGGSIQLAGAFRESQFALAQNSPNPFCTKTTISYSIPKTSRVRLSVFDHAGRLVATLLDSDISAGLHTATWHAESAPSAVYFYRLTAGEFTGVKKMILLR